jgi:hypothetical protein
MCVCASVYVRVRVCASVYVRVRVCACVYVCSCRPPQFPAVCALLAPWMAVGVTGISG